MIVITTSPEGDWFTVQHNGEVLACGHSPTVDDIHALLEHFNVDNEIKLQEVEE